MIIYRRFLPALALALAACNTDDVTAPPGPAAGEFTVNASAGWVYVSLRDSATVTPTPTATESDAWDIAFFATNVMLNGGAAGPGGMEGYCVCQNSSASNDQILAMTPESELGDYEAVNAIPGAATWVSEALTPAIRGWFSGTGAGAQAVTSKTYVVRLSDGTSYAKLRFNSLENQSATSAGRLSIEFAVQATGATQFAASQTLVVDLTTGPKSVDLNAGQVTTNTADWDVRFDGFIARVNGGASGSGSGGAYEATTEWSTITATTAPAIAYSGDVYAGIFGANPWYKYNILGDNRISPVFSVYLVRRGSTVWKVQLLNYYSATNAARHISFRYERIAQ